MVSLDVQNRNLSPNKALPLLHTLLAKSIVAEPGVLDAAKPRRVERALALEHHDACVGHTITWPLRCIVSQESCVAAELRGDGGPDTAHGRRVGWHLAADVRDDGFGEGLMSNGVRGINKDDTLYVGYASLAELARHFEGENTTERPSCLAAR